PYGRTWDPDMIDPLTSDDLRAFHRQWFVASNMYVVSSGNVVGETIAQITNAVELLPRGEKTVDQSIMLPTSEGLHRDIWREGVTQSSIRMGCLMPGKSSIDFIPLQLLTTVLGGYFSSRLMQNLREERGYTYGVYAGLATLRYASYMAIQCEVASEVQADAIEQIKYEIRRLTTEKISSEELAMAKNTIIGELMRLVDGPFGIADITIENLQSGVADDYINTFLARISSTTSDELLALAARYFDPERLTQVVVGSHKE
ncbi:MAG: pitrilysin family protein, partial [Mucinivorans sp.]